MKNMNNTAVSARKSNSTKAAARKADRKAKADKKESKATKPAEVEAAEVEVVTEATPVVVEPTPAVAEAAPAQQAAKPERPAAVAGATVTKEYKGTSYEVVILADGKRCTVNGTEYSSLSAAVRKVIGQQVSGQKFWGFAQGTRPVKAEEPAKVEEPAATEEAAAPAPAEEQQTEATETVEG